MDQSAADHGWQQLQANIKSFLDESLHGDGRRLEYKPRFIMSLPEMSSEHPQKDRRPF